MSDITKNKEGKSWNWFNGSPRKRNAVPILEKLSAGVEKEFKLRLRQINTTTGNLAGTEALHLSVDNLTNTKLAIERVLRAKNPVTEQTVLALLDEQIERAKTVLQSEIVAQSKPAVETGVRTINLLFAAKQAVKQKFLIPTELNLTTKQNGNPADAGKPKLSSQANNNSAAPRLVIGSTLLYQLHHSLFPAKGCWSARAAKTKE